MTISDRLIVALDVDRRGEALNLVERLSGRAGCFKIGSRLFTAEGPRLVEEMVAAGAPVFLDLKYHDIPSVVAEACLVAAQLGVSILTLHTLGGFEMMAAAARRVGEWRRSSPLTRPLLAGVTILTSMNTGALVRCGIERDLPDMVLRLARLSFDSGLDGVVASPQELDLLRAQAPASLKIITPGVRPVGTDAGDQQRTLTPSEALQRGADYLVIGRPITHAPDPVVATDRILEEMARTCP